MIIGDTQTRARGAVTPELIRNRAGRTGAIQHQADRRAGVIQLPADHPAKVTQARPVRAAEAILHLRAQAVVPAHPGVDLLQDHQAGAGDNKQ